MEVFRAAVLLLSLFFLLRCPIAFRNQNIIIDAIFQYRKESFMNNKVSYYDMESIITTTFRFWDFGYKHILPEDKFEIIEPYLK